MSRRSCISNAVPAGLQVTKGEWVVYILSSVPCPMRTYAGSTNNLFKRIRQHNGELTGGACATKTTRPWRLAALVTGFGDDKSRALRFEWFTKVKHYVRQHRKPVPGSSGPRRRRYLIDYARSMCLDGPSLILQIFDRNLVRTEFVPPSTIDKYFKASPRRRTSPRKVKAEATTVQPKKESI